MTFSRDDLAAYEAKPQTTVAEVVKDAPPAANADETDSVDTPSGDEAETGDPSVTGDGTSDENAASSTAVVEPGDESGTDEDATAGEGDEAPAPAVAPKKGSAAARIQELLDLTDGYKEYGKVTATELAEARAEIARLKSGGAPAPKTTPAEAPQEVADAPMPLIEDEDIAYDSTKYKEKMKAWLDARDKKLVSTVVATVKTTEARDKLNTHVSTSFATFAETHKDWDAKVVSNKVLIANQLDPEVATEVAKSEHVADIVYAFGNDDALAIRVAKLPKAQQSIEVGKIIAKIEAAKAAPVVPVAGAKPAVKKSLTNAPPPPTPVKAAGRPQQREETDPTLSMDDFAKRHRDAKQAKRIQNQKARGLVS